MLNEVRKPILHRGFALVLLLPATLVEAGYKDNWIGILSSPPVQQFVTDPAAAARPHHHLLTPAAAIDGTWIVPADLQEAWQALDKMLPPEIARQSELMDTEVGGCPQPPDKLVDWIADNWLASRSPLSRYFQTLGLDFGNEGAEEIVAAFIVCSYFRWRAGSEPDLWRMYHSLVATVESRAPPPAPVHASCAGGLTPLIDPRLWAPAEQDGYQTSNPSISVPWLWLAQCNRDGRIFVYNFWDGWFFDPAVESEIRHEFEDE